MRDDKYDYSCYGQEPDSENSSEANGNGQESSSSEAKGNHISHLSSLISHLTVGRLVLSPTRTYAPVVKRLLDELRPDIHGMVHCTGGAQTKVLHFVGSNCRVIKDSMFPVPPLFRIIHECSGTDWREMYQVFNMGHRMEVYVRPEVADRVIAVSKAFNIDAQVVGRIEEGPRSLTIQSEFGAFDYR